MLVALVVAFAVCWLPLHAFNVVLDVAPHLFDLIDTPYDLRIFLGIYLSCLWLAMANSFINPFIFGFLNESFKVHYLKDTLKHCKYLPGKLQNVELIYKSVIVDLII